ncbi:MAG: tRNA pseudouridine(38-40) synthase TruA [Alphaproteobacteria bacterium RIFCSPHIGHO2_12_FULL_63_12]|nr:MAG: tRNA pseudouridine(38-40) synthase TruA [Alphaproteobacteria bacterium RIFCSPHIGHO2_12_FULL_63_12]
MPRYFLVLEFDGGPFVGWQRQENGVSVQGALEEAVFRFCGERVTAHSAGRTDAGVHALGMPVHIDIEKETDADTIREAVNYHLKPAPVAALTAVRAADDFHARFSATRRHYRYRILNRRAPLTLDAGRAWRLGPPLDADAMHAAAQVLIGKHDFTTFRASTCQADTPVKTLSSISVFRRAEEILIETSARSFLHHQVRSMVGSLVEVGIGRWSAADFADAFKACDRRRCGQVAPAEGLYFVRADYGQAG